MVLAYDELLLINSRLPLSARSNLAQCCKWFHHCIGKWTDIKEIIIDSEHVVLSTVPLGSKVEKDQKNAAHFLLRVLEQCPKINKIVAQCQLSCADIRIISEAVPFLRHLVLPSDCFRVNMRSYIGLKFMSPFEKLVSLEILLRSISFRQSTNAQIALPLIKTIFVPTLQVLRLTGLALSRQILSAIFELKELKELYLCGCLVSSEIVSKTVHFEALKNLNKLSLPASMFSLFDAADNKIEFPFTLKELAFLRELTMHAELVEVSCFEQCLSHFFPRSLKKLRLNTKAHALPNTKEWNALPVWFEISLVRSDAIQMLNLKWSKTSFIGEFFWTFPYIKNENIPQRLILRENVMPVRVESWKTEALLDLVNEPERTAAPRTNRRSRSAQEDPAAQPQLLPFITHPGEEHDDSMRANVGSPPDPLPFQLDGGNEDDFAHQMMWNLLGLGGFIQPQLALPAPPENNNNNNQHPHPLEEIARSPVLRTATLGDNLSPRSNAVSSSSHATTIPSSNVSAMSVQTATSNFHTNSTMSTTSTARSLSGTSNASDNNSDRTNNNNNPP